MSIGKILLLAGMVLTVGALAVPSAASANGRVIETATGAPIGKGDKIEFIGELAVQNLSTGIACPVVMTVESDSSTVLTVTKFEIKTAGCLGFGSLFENCVMKSDTVKGLNWEVLVKTSDFTATDVTIDSELEKCKGTVTTNDLTFPSLTATPLNTAGGTAKNKEGIAAIELSGQGTDKTNLGNLTVQATGTLVVAGTDSPKCTYAIEEFK